MVATTAGVNAPPHGAKRGGGRPKKQGCAREPNGRASRRKADRAARCEERVEAIRREIHQSDDPITPTDAELAGLLERSGLLDPWQASGLRLLRRDWLTRVAYITDSEHGPEYGRCLTYPRAANSAWVLLRSGGGGRQTAIDGGGFSASGDAIEEAPSADEARAASERIETAKLKVFAWPRRPDWIQPGPAWHDWPQMWRVIMAMVTDAAIPMDAAQDWAGVRMALNIVHCAYSDRAEAELSETRLNPLMVGAHVRSQTQLLFSPQRATNPQWEPWPTWVSHGPFPILPADAPGRSA